MYRFMYRLDFVHVQPARIVIKRQNHSRNDTHHAVFGVLYSKEEIPRRNPRPNSSESSPFQMTIPNTLLVIHYTTVGRTQRIHLSIYNQPQTCDVDGFTSHRPVLQIPLGCHTALHVRAG